MKRRKFVGLVGAAGSLSALGASNIGTRGAKKPYNVLIIHTDEHSFRTLGCYRRVLPDKQALMWGSPVVDTPHIDSIADRGITADSFYAASPVCSPSRSSFISGLYPTETGVILNDTPIRRDLETFAAALQRAGYATGYAGKWHLDGMKEDIERNMADKSGKKAEDMNIYSYPEYFNGWIPQERGLGFADNRFMFECGHWKKIVSSPDGGNPTLVAPRDAIGDEKTFTTDWLADRTMEFIEENQNRPFCYMVSIPDPHGPDKVREPYYSMYKDAPFEEPYTANDTAAAPNWGKPNKKQYDHPAYFGMVKCIDDNVGRMLRKLDELGLSENTVVVFTADHGDMRGEHGRHDKGVPYEASAKVPFVMMAPGLIPAGIRTDAVLSTTDFKPTLLGLLGVRALKPSEGQDASGILRGKPRPAGWEDLMFSRCHGIHRRGWIMVLNDRFKLIAGVQDPLWLIDRQNDPEEQTNLAGNPKLKPVVRRMARVLLEHAQAHKEPLLDYAGGNLRATLEAAV